MTGKTKKELQVENSELKSELSDVKSKYWTLSEKCENLLKKLNMEEAKGNKSFRCDKCDTNF